MEKEAQSPRRGRPLRIAGPDCPGLGCRGPGLVWSLRAAVVISGESPPGSKSSLASSGGTRQICPGAGLLEWALLAQSSVCLPSPGWAAAHFFSLIHSRDRAVPPSPVYPVPPGISRTLGPQPSPPWPSCLPAASPPSSDPLLCPEPSQSSSMWRASYVAPALGSREVDRGRWGPCSVVT